MKLLELVLVNTPAVLAAIAAFVQSTRAHKVGRQNHVILNGEQAGKLAEVEKAGVAAGYIRGHADGVASATAPPPTAS